MNINFLDRPIAFHRPFVAITGSVTCRSVSIAGPLLGKALQRA